MNPTDSFRKEQRKKELKRNRSERKRVREVGLLRKDPEQIREQIQRLESMSEWLRHDGPRESGWASLSDCQCGPPPFRGVGRSGGGSCLSAGARAAGCPFVLSAGLLLAVCACTDRQHRMTMQPASQHKGPCCSLDRWRGCHVHPRGPLPGSSYLPGPDLLSALPRVGWWAWEDAEAEGPLEKTRKHKKRQLEDTLNLVLKKRKVGCSLLACRSLRTSSCPCIAWCYPQCFPASVSS